MKNLILGIAVLGLAIACKNTDNTSISDSAVVEAPQPAVCPMSGEAGAGCAAHEADCDQADKAGCEAGGSCCESAQDGTAVGPVTGEEVEN